MAAKAAFSSRAENIWQAQPTDGDLTTTHAMQRHLNDKGRCPTPRYQPEWPSVKIMRMMHMRKPMRCSST